MHTRHLLAASLAALVSLACGCVSTEGEEGGEGEEISEPFAQSTYYVVNTTDASVLFTAEPLWDEDSFSVSIPAGESVQVDQVSEGSGGHTRPSNFYASHTVEMEGVPIDRTLDDSDWTNCESGQLPANASPVGTPLCLVVGPQDFS